jgi:cell division protein ZipA
MEDTFRNSLIIISALVIAAIFVHGLWTIRKNKNPYKLKAKPEDVADLNPNFDDSGFDQYGVSQPKVLQKKNSSESFANLTETEIPKQAAPAPDYSEEPLPQDIHDPEVGEIDTIAMNDHMQNDLLSQDELPSISVHDEEIDKPVDITKSQHASNNESTATKAKDAEQELQLVVEHKSLYDDPVIHAKPKSKLAQATFQNKKVAAKELKKTQMEIDFEAESKREQAAAKKPEQEPEFLVVSVVTQHDELISGAALLPLLLTLGMRYGDMNIFHRHQDNAGNGDITFSLANVLNPGTFDLNNMESFTTKGVSLFMSLPNKGNAFEVFEQMISAAKQLAIEFNGQLLDDKRSVFTKQTEQHYVGKIREFERKQRINSF